MARRRSKPRSTPSALAGLAVALDGVGEGIVVLDAAWRYRYVNRTAAAILGRPVERLLGSHAWTEFPEAEGGDVHRAGETALASQEPVVLEAYLAPWDRWFENRIYPFGSGLLIFFSDVTRRRRAVAERDRVLGGERPARAEALAVLRKLRLLESVGRPASPDVGSDELARLLARLRAALVADAAAIPSPRSRQALIAVGRSGRGVDPADQLTPRQREVLRLVAEGCTSRRIAERLGLSPRTVEAHRAQIMARLGVRDLASLVRFAVRIGLVRAED